MADPAAFAFEGLTLPELVYIDIINARLKELQKDPTVLEPLFQAIQGEERDAFLNYLTQEEIGVHLGFSPLITYEVPQVVVTAAGGQDDRMIGNILRQELVNKTGVTMEVDADFTETAFIQTGAQAQTMTVANVTGTWPAGGVIQVGGPDGEVMAYEGDPTGGSITIIRRGLRKTALTTHPSGEGIVLEEMTRIFGTDEIANHWVDVVHPNSHFVLVLALVVRLAMLKAEYEGSFADKGLSRMSSRITDLAPHRMLYPNTTFVRSLQVECRYTISLDDRFELIHKPEAVGTVVIPDYVGGAP